ncbi:MAG: hypothetical protein FLDDKLPJ_03575 [Phycisphaerae bacterium]|nr:hypothetical protein [Phycisphaerae bacterium]
MNAHRSKKLLNAACPAMLLISTLPAAAQSVMYTNKSGWFDPDGTRSRRFSVIEAAACAAGDGGIVRMNAGTYREAMRIDWALRMEAENGRVTIGSTLPTTKLRVISYNTHLWGDALIGENCADDERAGYFGTLAHHENTVEQTDVLGMQEIWDDDYAYQIQGDSNYSYRFFGNTHDGAIQHSGLLLLSRHELFNTAQTGYDDKEGWDWFANKGFIQATINKDGYWIGVFNTHTQADDYEDTRRKQLEQLADAIRDYRNANPTHPVLVMGDFNVIGESSEYHGNMSDAMGGRGAQRDGMMNVYCTDDLYACTSCGDNEFRQHFDSDTDEFWRLDYILYSPSRDGRVDIVPTRYEVLKWQVPDGEPDVECGDTVTREISDHYGVLMEFDLHSAL